MALSEANYSLSLDYALPQDLIVPEQQGSESQSLLDQQGSESSMILYQRKDLSRNKLNQSDANNFEVDMYTSDFQLGIFLRSFFICLFYTSGIGMLLSALFPCFHSKFYKNYFIYSNNSLLRIIGSTTLIQLVFLIIMPKKEIEDVLGKAASVTNWTATFSALIIFSITSAAREAYCNKKLVEILKTVKLDKQSLSSTRFRVDHFWSREESSRMRNFEAEKKAQGISKEESKKEKERFMQELSEYETTGAIQNTICKLDMNMSLCYLNFFEGAPENLLRKLKQKQDLSITEREDFLVYNERFPEQDFLKAISHFEHDIFEYKYFTESNKYDEKKAFGYSFALDLLLNKKQKKSAAAIMIWVFLATLFCFQYLRDIFKLFTKTELQEWSVKERIFAFVFTIPIARYFSWIPYTNILFIIFQGIKIMTAKYLHMEELKELMSTKKERLDNKEEKSYPTLNILDFKSLESWMQLRKIFMHLYDEKFQGIILAISLSLIIQLVELISSIFLKLALEGSPNSGELIQYGLHIALYLSIFLIFAYFAAKVNAQFKVHKEIIRANKKISKWLFKYYSDFVGENTSKPGKYIENEGVKFLKKQYGENISPEIKKEMKEEENNLLATYDSIIEELEDEERENPIKILGLPITKIVVKSFGTLLVSILLSVLKASLSSLFKK